MKSHDLAKRLLKLPNLEVVSQTEDDGFEKLVVNEINVLKGMQYLSESSWSGVPCYSEISGIVKASEELREIVRKRMGRNHIQAIRDDVLPILKSIAISHKVTLNDVKEVYRKERSIDAVVEWAKKNSKYTVDGHKVLNPEGIIICACWSPRNKLCDPLLAQRVCSMLNGSI